MFHLLDLILNIFTFLVPLILTIKILDSSITFKYSCYQFLLNYWLYFVVFQYLQYTFFANNLVYSFASKATKFWLFYGRANNLRLLNDFVLVRFVNMDMVQLFEVRYINPFMNKLNPGFREINYQIYLSGKLYLRPIDYDLQSKFLSTLAAMLQPPPPAKSLSKSKSRQSSSTATKIMKKLRKPKRTSSGESSHSDSRSRSSSTGGSTIAAVPSSSRSRRGSSPGGGERPGSRSIYSSGSSTRSSNPTSPTLNPVDYQTVAEQLPPTLLSIPKYRRNVSPPPYEEVIPDVLLSEPSAPSSIAGSRSVSRQGSFSSPRMRPLSSSGSPTGSATGSVSSGNHDSIDYALMTNSGNAEVRLGSEAMNRIQEQLNPNNGGGGTRNQNDLPPLPTPGMMNR
ncbi:hypothetical protein Cantr_10356 [Candida viswanathii]|uniref:Uncharacterized protein n=1 Tax=Candida viswanathii TaxID=5486 RepID=A0A367YDI9_9ASCO|nr:hypothetical protein Cantr_10356 [Candida viswanathii]